MNNNGNGERDIISGLNQSIESLPPQTEQALIKARQSALRERHSNKKAQMRNYMPIAFVMASCVSVALWYSLQLPLTPTYSNQALELQLLGQLAEISDDEIEVVENLDFAMWLLDQKLRNNPS